MRRLIAWTAAGLIGALLASVAPSAQGTDQASADGAFAEDERLLSVSFFWRGPWDDVAINPDGTLGMRGTWKAIYPAQDDPRASIFGLNSPDNWPENALPDTARWPVTYKDENELPLWLMAEWRAMKWSGFDFVLLDDWHCLCFKEDLSPYPCFEGLAQAWLELDKRGEKPLPFAMFLETPFAWHNLDKKDRDATQTSSDGICELWEPTRAFLRQFYGEDDYRPILPLRALARVMVNGEARPLMQFWFPTWVDAGLEKWNKWTFEQLRRKCKETFGVEPFVGVNQHVYGPTCMGGWSSEQPAGGKADITFEAGVVDYDVAWWGGMAGPQVYPNAISIGPGHWCPTQSGDKPVALHWDPVAYKPDRTRYAYCWRKVLSDPENFKRRIMIVESWNNNYEACAISYSEPKDFKRADGTLIDRWGELPEEYMALTRELAPYWKQGKCPPR